MSKGEVEVDATQVLDMFAELEPRRRKQAFRATLNKSSNILIRETRKTLGGVVVNPKSPNWWDGKQLQSGIKKRMAKDAKSIKIHIMGDFRLKFFEMGTANRRTEGHKITGKKRYGARVFNVRQGKGGNRGKILGEHFFAKAKKNTETRIFSTIEKDLAYQIERINNKYL